MKYRPRWGRIFFLFCLALAGAAYWRPDWRDAAVRSAAPFVQRAVTRARHWARDVRPPWSGTAPVPAPEQAPGSPALPPTVTRPDRAPEVDRVPTPPPAARPPAAPAPLVPAGNLPPRLPDAAAPPTPSPELRQLQARLRTQPTAAGYRRLAEAALATGMLDLAADAFRREAQIYRRLGDPNAAAVEEQKAARYRVEAEIYVHASETPSAALDTGARLEPPYGAYLGAFIDRDDQIADTFLDENWQTHRDPAPFERLTGRTHASYFCYLQYGKPFPSRWAERLRERGAIPHLAWEPRHLSDVREDRTLLDFAEAVGRFDAPIFIRFAGEMNGDWTPYHGNPALYREKFRLIHRVLSRRAPHAALIWCPNHIPDAKIDAYYPGDDAVDWVGVNFYNVLFFDNDAARPAAHVHPADMLRAVYHRYAARKPIAICEYAASQQAAVDPQPRPEVATARMAQLYAALPRRFPRVKLIDWFDCNNLRHARPERQLNNYSLTEDSRVLNAYRDAVASDYFLSRSDEQPSAVIRPIAGEEALAGVVTLSAWVRAPIDRPRVYLLAGDEVLYAGDLPGEYLCRWDTRRLAPGARVLRLVVLDREGRRLREVRRRVRVVAEGGL